MESERDVNNEIERLAIAHVMELERQAGRQPKDVHNVRGVPYDVDSPPRKIEVKAVSGSARGAPIPIEHSQLTAALADPESYYLYIVDNVAADGRGTVRVLHGPDLRELLTRAVPQKTYWPTFRVGDYDRIEPAHPETSER